MFTSYAVIYNWAAFIRDCCKTQYLAEMCDDKIVLIWCNYASHFVCNLCTFVHFFISLSYCQVSHVWKDVINLTTMHVIFVSLCLFTYLFLCLFCEFRRLLKTFLFGQWGHSAVWTLLTVPSRNILTYLLIFYSCLILSITSIFYILFIFQQLLSFSCFWNHLLAVTREFKHIFCDF